MTGSRVTWLVVGSHDRWWDLMTGDERDHMTGGGVT